MKKFLSLLLVIVCVMGMMVPAHAVDDIDNAAQQELNETMSIVMDYLNEHNDISLDQRVVQEYEIPIAEDQYVKVTVSNEQVPTTRSGGSSGLDIKYYDVVAGMSYNFTLTISNFYLNSGEIVYTVNYTVKDGDGKIFKTKVNSVDVSATAPTTCSLIEQEGYDYDEGKELAIVKTYGYAAFSTWFGIGKLCMMVEAKFSGFVQPYGYEMMVIYEYYDQDDREIINL